MNVLLINANRMKSPPVIPVGLEYLATSLQNHGHSASILDLCFSEDLEGDLQDMIEARSYDVVGFTIRNIDSALFFNNEFFLPRYRSLIKIIKENHLPIVLGGAGFSAMPHEILEFLEGDFGIMGPGDRAFPQLLNSIDEGKMNPKIWNGWEAGIDPEMVPLRAQQIDYSAYTADEGIVGFTTSYGCPNRCPYCIESQTPVHFRTIPSIIRELSALVQKGYNHFHTCDCEFNTNLQYSIEFCKALINEELDLKWALYMKPYPYNEELFEVLKASNAYLITLSVDSFKEIQSRNHYSYQDLRRIISYCHKYDLKLAIDLLTGYPYEPQESTVKVINFFKENRPSRVGISFIYRLYRHTELAELILEDEALHEGLSKPLAEKENFLKPIFYSQPIRKYIEDLIEGEDIFELAGLTSGVNYQLTE